MGFPCPSFQIEFPNSLLVFGNIFRKGLGTHMKHSSAFHPKTNWQAECTIQTLEDMLRSCNSNLKGSWDDHQNLIEFSYNNSYHSIISIETFKDIYGKRCRCLIGWFEVSESLLRTEIIYEAIEKFLIIRYGLKTTYSRKKPFTHNRRRELEFEIVDYVYLII